MANIAGKQKEAHSAPLRWDLLAIRKMFMHIEKEKASVLAAHKHSEATLKPGKNALNAGS